MRSCIYFLALWAFLSTEPCAAHGSIPSWLLGDWVVTKIYKPDAVYPEPDAEPQVRLDGKAMTISPNRLSLGGEVCADLDIKSKYATVAQVLLQSSAQKPEDIGLTPRKGRVSYLEVRCAKSFMDETVERTNIDYIKWYVVIDEQNRSEIELAFLGGVYLELHRPSPTS